MKLSLAVVLIILAFSLLITGCGSSNVLPKELHESVIGFADMYEDHRDEVIALIDFFKGTWESVPDELKPKLLELYDELPRIDRWGQLAVLYRDGLTTGTQARGIDVDKGLDIVMKAASLYTRLHGLGIV